MNIEHKFKMNNFEIQGDISDISARQLEFISGVLTERGFETGIITIEPVGKAGDNYVANVKRITITKDGRQFKMIAKIAPSSEILRKVMNTSYFFKNENVMYTTILPKFTELEMGVYLPESERLRYAACYGTFMEEPNEVILLEDLNVSNFVMLEKFNSLTSDNIKLVLRSFALLHSLSYVLKNQEPETFQRFCRELIDMRAVLNNMEDMKIYMIHLETELLTVLDNNKHKQLVKGTLTQLGPIANRNRKFYKESKSSVIEQGDAWTNNIMFRLEDEEVVECCMIDYQGSNHTSPVLDIQYLIFNCTDYETRAQHYCEWIDYYHTELDKRLYYFGLKVNDFYTRDRLDADLRRNARISFGETVMLASMLLREHDEAAKIKEAMTQDNSVEVMLGMSKFSLMESSSMNRFKARIEGLIRSYIEFGYFV